jgi:hypothetical protein
MTSVDLAGLGIWGEAFSSWEQFRAVVRGESVEPNARLQPELIPARERRRAPQFVKMAVEVMDQACRMAEVDQSSVATIFASGMGDMQITDYMCRTLTTMPRTVSPTKFHNSVHNAATGYWSIATASNSPANAVSGYDHSAAVALLEGAVQAVEEEIPVLVAVQEMAAPTPFKSVYDGEHPLAAALLLAPAGHCASPVGQLSLTVVPDGAPKGETPGIAGVDLEGNFAAELVGLLLAIAAGGDCRSTLPLSASTALSVEIVMADTERMANG